MNTVTLGFIILPLFVGSFFLGSLYLFAPKTKTFKSISSFIAIFAPFLSFIFVINLFFDALKDESLIFYQPLFSWFKIGAYEVNIALFADHLSIFMTLFITFIGLLIHIYATGYMKNEDGYGKFFAYFNLFMGFMLLLILADGPILMFFGWEGVGLCSYLLIAYYHEKIQSVNAGNKAFIVNRIGDFGFLIGLALLFVAIGEYGFDYLSLSQNINQISPFMLSVIAVLLFIGAMGKSAQIPLYVWLPDAMAGPTPVSALIHAATMVTAGLYMVARFGFLYDLVPNVGLFIAYLGAFSALFAAIIATVQRDIKKILAYSTISQLGYMFTAVGLGAYDAGLFHVFTHAFFKALLFLGAGSIIIALHHEQDIFKMGGLYKKMPLTFITMSIGTLAICAIAPFSGFFSKDAIMLSVFASQNYLLWAILLFTAGLTAYYMSRLMVVVFISPSKKPHNLHRLTKPMQGVLIALAVGSLLAGGIGIPEIFGGSNLLGAWLFSSSKYHISHSFEYFLMAVNTIAALVGIFIGYKLFAKNPKEPNLENGFIKVVAQKFYVDEFYAKIIIAPLKKMSLFFSHHMDVLVIDNFINSIGKNYKEVGKKLGLMQNSSVRAYAFYMVVGISIIFIYINWIM